MADYKLILDRCAKGDAKSQRLLYDLLKGKVMGICYRYGGSTEVAADIFQDTMVKVFRNIREAQNVDSLIAWVTRITVNTAIDYTRRKKPQLFAEIEDLSEVDITDQEASIIEQMQAHELLELLRELPLAQMQVFNLYMIEGFSHGEIAIKIGVAESSSRVLLSRAKGRLIELLSKIKLHEKAS